MGYPGALIYSLDASGVREVRYQDTEHYAVTKVFLTNPERMLREVFAEAEASRAPQPPARKR